MRSGVIGCEEMGDRTRKNNGKLFAVRLAIAVYDATKYGHSQEITLFLLQMEDRTISAIFSRSAAPVTLSKAHNQLTIEAQ